MPKTINKSSQIYFVTTKGMFQYTKTPHICTHSVLAHEGWDNENSWIALPNDPVLHNLHYFATTVSSTT